LQKGRQFNEALKAYQRAREIRQQLVDLDSAEKEYQRALANTVMNIGSVEMNLKDHQDQAARDFELAQVSRRAQIAGGDDSSKLLRDLAMGYYDQGILELTIGEVAVQPSQLDEKVKHLDAAQKRFEESIAEFQQVAKRDPRDLSAQYLSAICYGLLGGIKSKSNQLEDSLRLYGLARDTLARLVEQNPDVSEYKSALAGVYMNLGRQQQGQAALDSFQKARESLAELVEKYPDNTQFNRDLRFTLRSLSDAQLANGQRDAARSSLKSALDLLTRLTEKFPKNAELATELARTREALKKLGD